MKSKLKLFASWLIPVFALLALAGFYFGKEFAVRADQARAVEAAASKELQEFLAIQTAIAPLKNSSDPNLNPHVNQQVKHLIVDFASLAFTKRVDYGVKLDTLEVTSAGAAGSSASQMIKSVPSTSDALKYVSIKLKGGYDRYQGFLDYVQSLHALPVAIVKINASNKTFEIDVQVFGI